jgi:hypothetical protein
MATGSNLETECEIGEAFRSSEHGGGGDRSGWPEAKKKEEALEELKAFSSPQPSLVTSQPFFLSQILFFHCSYIKVSIFILST